MNEYVFSLYEVCGITFLIETSDNETATWPTIIFPRNEIKVRLLPHFDHWLRNIYVTHNTWNSEGRILDTLEFRQQLLIECIASNVVNTIRICLPHHFKSLIILVSRCSRKLWREILNILEGSLHVFG